ncbi:MAG TPA: hypothetical protein VI636_09395 [Candidatus Angelobacter sp.]
MKKFLGMIGMLSFIMLLVIALAAWQQVGEQNLLKLSFVGKGVSSTGTNVLQTGEVNSITAPVATATLTRIVFAPASGQTYIRRVMVEKSTGSTGTFTLQYGTGTNCGTGTTVLFGPVTNPQVVPHYIGILVPAGQDLCAQTDASTTSVRVLYN